MASERDDDESTDDGLPLDAARRRQAIDREFEDFKAQQVASLSPGARADGAVERLQSDLLAVIEHHAPTLGVHGTVQGWFAAGRTICALASEAEPGLARFIDTELLSLHSANAEVTH
ncbi:MAG: hypothetical protein ACREUZ_01540 [Burkholderiales bacterium]